VAALVGGGSGLARPGALSLAHRGVLFLDEAPEFGSAVLNALRQPLEDGVVRLARSRGGTVYPARVQLVLAANPCPCASAAGPVRCECSALTRRRYLGRLSGPLLDRVDLHVTLPKVTAAALAADPSRQESSATVARRVAQARDAAAARWAGYGWCANAEVPGPALRRPPWRLPRATTVEASKQLDSGRLSARGFDRVLRTAWTIADLDGAARPTAAHVSEAVELRKGGPTT
jgi:magnesium chelatase family protein